MSAGIYDIAQHGLSCIRVNTPQPQPSGPAGALRYAIEEWSLKNGTAGKHVEHANITQQEGGDVRATGAGAVRGRDGRRGAVAADKFCSRAAGLLMSSPLRRPDHRTRPARFSLRCCRPACRSSPCRTTLSTSPATRLRLLRIVAPPMLSASCRRASQARCRACGS